MSPLNIAVIIGSTRPNRFGDKPAHWIAQEAKKLENVEVEVLDLRDYKMPFYDEPVSPSGIQDGAYADEIVRKWAQKINHADAYIIVTPEYNHSTSAVLKNALDHVYREWNNKAVAFVGYGSVGGARAVEHLRQMAVELHMASTRQAVHIPGNVVFPIAFGGAQWTEEIEASLKESADTMLKQLVWWGKALKDARAKTA